MENLEFDFFANAINDSVPLDNLVSISDGRKPVNTYEEVKEDLVECEAKVQAKKSKEGVIECCIDETLPELMEERGLNTRQLADITNISEGTLYDWKAGRKTPRVGPDLFKLAQFFGETVDYILYGIDPTEEADKFKIEDIERLKIIKPELIKALGTILEFAEDKQLNVHVDHIQGPRHLRFDTSRWTADEVIECIHLIDFEHGLEASTEENKLIISKKRRAFPRAVEEGE